MKVLAAVLALSALAGTRAAADVQLIVEVGKQEKLPPGDTEIRDCSTEDSAIAKALYKPFDRQLVVEGMALGTTQIRCSDPYQRLVKNLEVSVVTAEVAAQLGRIERELRLSEIVGLDLSVHEGVIELRGNLTSRLDRQRLDRLREASRNIRNYTRQHAYSHDTSSH